MNKSELMIFADGCFVDGRIQDAIDALEEYLSKEDELLLWRKLAHAYVRNGQVVPAILAMRNVIYFIKQPMEWEVAVCRRPLSRCVVVPQYKIIYVNIPKCGSSTLKDAIHYMLNSELVAEHSHTAVNTLYQVVKREEFKKKYEDWTRVLVVRDPILRVRSYYHKNVADKNSLQLEAKGKEVYRGLSTRPTYAETLKNFHGYRRAFVDFLHHTNPITDLAGLDASNYNVIADTCSVGDVIQVFSEKTGIEIPNIHNMKCTTAIDLTEEELELEEGLRSFYASDYGAYGEFFAREQA